MAILRRYGMSYAITYNKYIFYVIIQIFFTVKSGQDPDPHCFGSLVPDLDPHGGEKLEPETSADPKHCFFPSLLKLVLFPRLRLRIRIGVRLPL